MNDRINIVRKELGLTLEKFGEKIGVTKSSMSNMEKGSRGITDRTVRDICREFCVNEEWLRHGVGDMFKDIDEDEEVAIYVSELLENEDSPLNSLIIEIMRTYYRLDPMSQKVIDNAIEIVVENIEKKKRD